MNSVLSALFRRVSSMVNLMVVSRSRDKRPRGTGKFDAYLLFSFFLLSLLIATTSNAAQVTLAWDASTDPEVTGYKLYQGTQSRQYTFLGDAGLSTASVASGLVGGTTYYFAVTAYNSTGLESTFSNEVSYTAPVNCTYTISPTSKSFTSSAGTGSITVTTQTGCAWTANGGSWVTITSGASGTGSGTVVYSVAANTTTSSRTAATTVAGQAFTVTQAGITGYTITASAGTGGSISPSGGVAVASGGSKSFTITPATGYTISSVTVDGSSVGAVSSYTFSNVTGNHTIAASFKANAYVLTVTKTGTGTGTVTTNPSGASFTAGAVVSLTVAASTGSTFSGWSGACSGTSSTCQVTMNSNVSVSASFTATVSSYTITASAGTGGSISPSGSVRVPSGGSQSFTVTPRSGYKISYLLVDGNRLSASNSYVFSNVKAAHSIRALFSRRYSW